MAGRPLLRKLSEKAGILAAYTDVEGRRRPTRDDSRVRLLAALGLDASTEAQAAATLEDLDRRERDSLLAPCRVVGRRGPRAASLRVPSGAGSVAWTLEVIEENGAVHRAEGNGRPRGGRLRVLLPAVLSPGYHRIRARASVGAMEREAEQALIVTPVRCLRLEDVIGRRRAFGLVANLYTVKSAANWGVGDLSDLRALAAWAGSEGAAFVGINPLHAIRNRGWQISPYGPVSRLYRNPIYLDVSAVPELDEAADAREWLASGAARAAIERLRGAARIDYEGVAAVKRRVLEGLYRVFRERHLDRGGARGEAFAAYAREEGQALEDFATWCALDDRFSPHPAPHRSWREWPSAFRDPRSETVRRFRAEHAAEVDFHRYVQFELDRQLGVAAGAARAAGLPLGIYQDLAIGSAPDGCDTWAFPGLFVQGATLGAPPDEYAPHGQNWGIPPIDPRRLRAQGYAYFRRLLRASMSAAGALRIDHVMGLHRQFWVPRGGAPEEGAYVCFPAEDLLGILALESARARAVVIGEDLGTVPRGLSAVLARRGILSSRVFYFQRDREGRFLRSSVYTARALLTANTHDHAPLAGFFRGSDLDLMRRTGVLRSEAELASARARRRKEWESIGRRLRIEGVIGRGDRPEGVALRRAVYAFLARTPARLLGVSLDDLSGEEEAVNVPGVTQDRHPAWSRRMAMSLEALRADPGAREILAAVASRALRRTPAALRHSGEETGKEESLPGKALRG